jgi:hypothetical protein
MAELLLENLSEGEAALSEKEDDIIVAPLNHHHSCQRQMNIFSKLAVCRIVYGFCHVGLMIHLSQDSIGTGM